MQGIWRASVIVLACAVPMAQADTGGRANAAIYTAEQAKQGEAVYAQHCSSCHGDRLQGVAAPSVAGKDFLSTAEHNGWTIGMLRTIVTQNMPFNDPASLTDTEYANVIAYLLASNCYPAGNKKFPEEGTAAIANVKIHSPDHPSHTPDDHGLCSVN
jgi:polar amino acid transport system substrate-binding protein